MIYESQGIGSDFLTHADLTAHETPGIGAPVLDSWNSAIDNIFKGAGEGFGTLLKVPGAMLDSIAAHIAWHSMDVVSEAMPASAIGAPATPLVSGLDAAKSAVDKIGVLPMLAFAAVDRNDLGAMPSQLTNSAKPAQEQGVALAV